MHPDELRDRVQPLAAGSPATRWHDGRSPGSVTTLAASGSGWDAAAVAVDRAVDAGAAVLLLAADTSPGIHARAITAIYCGIDASGVTPFEDSDLAWMTACAAIRDVMPNLRSQVLDPRLLLSPDSQLDWQTSCIAHAAARRTPIVIAGALPSIAALCAQRVTPSSATWVHWGLRSDDPAAAAAQDRLAAESWFTTSLQLTESALIDVLRIGVEMRDAEASR